MYKDQKGNNRFSCLAIIPARGGSKRIPRKNVLDFCGLPIIVYTIQAALKSGLFRQVIVSTDDPEIAEVSKQFGAEIPFIRTHSLADDYTPVSEVTLDALNQIDPEGTKFNFIAQLMSNCPLRTEEDIINSFTQFRTEDADSQISITHYGWQNPWWAMKRDSRKMMHPIFEDRVKERSQDLPELFCPTGAIWWISADALRREKTFHCENKTGWEIAWDHGVDIDTEDDWNMAEMLMKNRNGLL
ncbi:pseudaminic acid cytidylyltransferase [Methanospirillum lacunae]|uniref:Pseudaminic acid cytidylyltransferase n=1 Tax=Methanospirillum lacunae TaxID=668570 RepID=A0A2V2MR56_9EURY|nr:pseudaminic acid cytidylyltransferase [Methanospirillum lacunae]PWR70714.1 pseudaminic acid cytidylyltransferase [Methanospirillum lacunae]